MQDKPKASNGPQRREIITTVAQTRPDGTFSATRPAVASQQKPPQK